MNCEMLVMFTSDGEPVNEKLSVICEGLHTFLRTLRRRVGGVCFTRRRASQMRSWSVSFAKVSAFTRIFAKASRSNEQLFIVSCVGVHGSAVVASLEGQGQVSQWDSSAPGARMLVLPLGIFQKHWPTKRHTQFCFRRRGMGR